MKRTNLSITVNLSPAAMSAVRQEAIAQSTYATGILRNAIREHFNEKGENTRVVDPAITKINGSNKQKFGEVLVASFSNPEVKNILDKLYLQLKKQKERGDFVEFDRKYYSFQAYMREEVIWPYLTGCGYEIEVEEMIEKRKLEEA